MGEITLVTGGGRSGKSAYGQQLAEGAIGPRTYIATCPLLDEEMRQRVDRHKADRAGRGWATIEEGIDLANAISCAQPNGVILIDCLTLWVNNLMFDAEQQGVAFTEDDIIPHVDRLIDGAKGYRGNVIIVTNETGLGIIPANAMARLFRDVAGRCNQCVAAKSDNVVFMVSGIPMEIKGGDSCFEA